jgi:DNA-binding NarL/FixJ family response regulator
MTTQILIVDDHQIVRDGVRGLLNTTRPEWSIVEARDGNQALEMIETHTPDLVIMDITMPGLSGLQVVSGLRKSGFHRPVLMFTMHKSEQLGNETRNAGAQGYVLKSQAVEDLIQAIDTLLAGGTFYGAPPSPDKGRDKPNPNLMFFVGLNADFA